MPSTQLSATIYFKKTGKKDCGKLRFGNSQNKQWQVTNVYHKGAVGADNGLPAQGFSKGTKKRLATAIYLFVR